jgi:hypothetical protein
MKSMEHSYFRLMDDMTTDQRWYLEDPVGPGDEWLGTTLVRSQRYQGPVPLTSLVHHPGPPLELTVTLGTVPVINDRVAEIITKHARDEAQLLPIVVPGVDTKLWAVNTLVAMDCIDDARSGDIRRYTEADGRPDRIGEYKLIVEMRIDPARAGGHALFRPKGWWVTTIISQPLADDLRRAGVRCNLTPVS